MRLIPRSHQSFVTLTILVALASACSDPSEPKVDQPAEQITLDSTEVTLTAIGDSATVTARWNGQSDAKPTYVQVEEARWLDEVPVLSQEALVDGVLVATGPGRMVLEAKAFGKKPDTLTVHVRPAQPAIFGLGFDGPVGDGDTLRLRGYGLREIPADSITIGEDSVAILGGDSATLLLSAPTAHPRTCRGSAWDTLSVRGARIHVDRGTSAATPPEASTDSAAPSSLQVLRKRADDLVLEVGEARMLTDTHLDCLRLRAQDSARYAVAYYDIRMVERARTGPEATASDATFILVDRTATDTTATMGITVQGEPNAGPEYRPGDPLGIRTATWGDGASNMRITPTMTMCPRTDGYYPECRATPWTEGERFAIQPPLGDPDTARVLRVEGPLVLALYEPHDSLYTEVWKTAMDSAVTLAHRYTIPILREAVIDTTATTSLESGQLLVLLRSFTWPVGAAFTTARSKSNEYEVSSVITINVGNVHASLESLFSLLAHEMAHAWVNEYKFKTRPAGVWDAGRSTLWGGEGVANLLASESLRNYFGIELQENYAWREQDLIENPPEKNYFGIVSGAGPLFTKGYNYSAPFLQDLLIRLIRAGVPYETAIRQVSRGPVEGWFGYDEDNYPRSGLTKRMRGHLDPAWAPVDAVLQWVMSQAIDDLTDSEVYQNRAFKLAMGDPDNSDLLGWGWEPDHEFTSGEADSVAITRKFGSTGFSYITDHRTGGSYALRTQIEGFPAADSIRWMIARFQ